MVSQLSFSIFFWPDLKHFLYRSIKEGCEKGELSVTQKMGIISILPKGNKPREYLKNWRPISLLNVTYKIFSYCLASRIKILLPYLIHENQTGFLKNRYIGENTRILYDIMQHLEENNKEGLFVMIDFEKAFDSVSWRFIDKVLDFFKFGPIFKNYIKCLNNHFKLCVIQHGFFSPFFTVGRGCRQGDPISPYIFLLCVEILGILIRNNEHIRGIKILDKEIKISQYADDTGLFLDGTKHSLKNSLSLIEQFAKYSGLKPNIDKCRCVWLGSKKHSEEFDIKGVNTMPFIVTEDTKLRWFQYKIIHRIITTNKLLHKMKISNSTLCNFCNNDEETILRLFYTCEVTNSFWRNLFVWIQTNSNVSLDLEHKTIIFGVRNIGKCTECINLMLILAKYYIFVQKITNGKPELPIFLLKLKYYFKMEKYIYTKKNRTVSFEKRWNEFVNILET